ncbi:MAG: 16S rRNA (cytidine(1402)-2'-O)-methyltransferase [Candidatus Baltobacteraceae bacterium]|jgi:16S rRNA (cytidine1402-2'-O)-methyltransferase
MGLVIVPTPIGNLRDVTLRALDVLQAATLVVAEDTRTTRKLLSAHGIAGKELWSYREQNAARVTPAILERAAAGTVAIVSDAGTPGVSDPGRELIVAARSAGISVEVLPGPAAFVCAAVLSGFELDGFSFEGFMPRRSADRRTALAAALARGRTAVWYEAPHRIAATLAELERLRPDAALFLARELTKVHEQQLAGTPAQVRAALPVPVRGEIALVLGPWKAAPSLPPPARDEVDAAIDAAIDAGLSSAAAAKAVAALTGLERGTIYQRIALRKRTRSARDDGTEAPGGS